MDEEIAYLEQVEAEMVTAQWKENMAAQRQVLSNLIADFDEDKMMQTVAVQPFMDKFVKAHHNPIDKAWLKNLQKRTQEKCDADYLEKQANCHKVTSQSLEAFEKTLNTQDVRELIAVANRTRSFDRCPLCSVERVPRECHCHKYYCKECHKDKVCSQCNLLTVYPPEVFHYQYYCMYVKRRL